MSADHVGLRPNNASSPQPLVPPPTGPPPPPPPVSPLVRVTPGIALPSVASPGCVALKNLDANQPPEGKRKTTELSKVHDVCTPAKKVPRAETEHASVWFQLQEDTAVRILQCAIFHDHMQKLLVKEPTVWFASVCKGFHRAVSVALNSSSECKSLTPLEIASLKSILIRTDLSFVHKPFAKEFKRRLSAEIEESDDVVEFVLEEFMSTLEFEDLDDFCREVELEYKKLLLVKTIEARELQASTAGSAAASHWTIRSQPATVIDMFWHSHMCHPQKYAQLCMSLSPGRCDGVEFILDHEPGYVMPADCDPQAQTLHKRGVLFHDKLNLEKATLYMRLRLFPSFARRFMLSNMSLVALIAFTEEGTVSEGEHESYSDLDGYDDCG